MSYHLATVVDDADAGITDIIRGYDLLDSTPRQIYLQQVLALHTPDYVHLPIAVDANGDKLSKQTHARPVDTTQSAKLLLETLILLQQNPDVTLVKASTKEILQWAITHWDRTKILQRRSIECIDQ